jgi:hypothetical protein
MTNTTPTTDPADTAAERLSEAATALESATRELGAALAAYVATGEATPPALATLHADALAALERFANAT